MQTFPAIPVRYNDLPFQNKEKIGVAAPIPFAVIIVLVAQQWYDFSAIGYAVTAFVTVFAVATLLYGARTSREGRQQVEWLETNLALESSRVTIDSRFLANSPQHPHPTELKAVGENGKVVPRIQGSFAKGNDGREYAIFFCEEAPPPR